ncbi:YraN family protein [Seleniivibrio sp.]|uniref:YraN family protein n=1 Tax=Seleniivibrio sp. TaxID=2898801 RepID=UPI0025D0D499|nr:YraN family protein [Seleniivibrio sp.]MCD8553988.1 YraN family protein [Seleniivibrio sp.]
MILGLGQSGEKKAEKYLLANGYEVLDKNYRCKFGEIDIIAAKEGVLIFVEVKTRSSGGYGMGFESVTKKKQEKLLLTAQTYMVGKKPMPARFDVISIDNGEITHIKNAFGV